MSEFSEAEVKVLKALAAGLLGVQGAAPSQGQVTNGQSPSGDGEALEDHQLEKPWADSDIRKDPPRYSGPSFVGQKFSSASAEWHNQNASFHDWKASKGREENPVRLNNKGKPWHESDTFTAKLSRAWAKRNAAHPPQATAAPPYDASVDESDIPF